MEFKISKGMAKISILIFLSLFLISLFLFYPKQEAKAQVENPEINSSIGADLEKVNINNITYYRLSFNNITLLTPVHTTCYWHRGDWRDCEQTVYIENNLRDINLNQLKQVNKIEPFLASFTTNRFRNLTVEYPDVLVKGNNTIYFKFNYPANTGEEWNLTFTNGTNKWEIDPDISACSVLDADYGVYNLTADISNSAATYCMNISANHVIFDCQGHTIDGTDASSTYGIYVSRSPATTTNITIKNCVLTDWDFGIYLDSSNSNTLSNITSNSNSYGGIYLDSSNSNTLSNITSNSNSYGGIELDSSNSNTLSNITSNSNSYNGIELDSSNSNTLSNITSNSNSYNGIELDHSDYTTIKDSNLINSTHYDVYYITDRTAKDCHSNFTNVIGTDNKPIVFYNTSTTIKDWDNNASEIILCGADNSVIDNVTMSHTAVKNNGLLLMATNLTNISNSVFNDSYEGIYLLDSYSNILSNITTNSNEYGIELDYSGSNTLSNITSNSNYNFGIELDYSGSNTLSNITSNSNSYYGIKLDSSDSNTLSNITSNSNEYGIELDSSDSNTLSNITSNSNEYGIELDYSSSNTIKDSIIQNNSQYGIYLYIAGNPANSIYNNLFNNTKNFYFGGIIYANYWNTTRQAGTRIYSPGTEIGGNYWTNSTGNGYSDTCTDADKDGFCDTAYIIDPGQTGNNTDYLPLSNKYSPPDTTPPTYSLNSTNSTLAGIAVSHNLFWQDNAGLSGYIFSWCNGTFDNTSTTVYNWTSPDKESGINNIKADYSITTYNWTSPDQETNTKQFIFSPPYSYPLTFTTQQVESLSVTPLNSDKFVVAWCDEASKTINFKIYSTTGQVLVDTVTVDTSSGITNACDYTSVSVSALNSTHFAIAWFDAAEADATFAVYDSSGALKIGPIDEDTDVGASGFSVSVSAFNSTHIVIGYYDYTDQDATFSTWNLATQTRVAGPKDVDSAVGTDGWGVSVAALDSNNFAFGFIDGADNDATFAIYTITGTAVKTATDEDTDIGASTSVSVVALNSTHWVFAYHDATDADVTFSIYNSAGTRVAGPVDEDTNVGAGGFVSAFGINSTHWGMVYYDAVDYNHTFSIYNQNTRVVGPIDISYSTLKWVAGASYLNSINLGICNQNWIFAEAYTTNNARLFGYTSSGTQWNGYCGPATEQNSSWQTYSGIDGDDYQNVDKIKVIVTIDSYNPSASNSTYDNNNRPDIEIGIWNGTAYVNNSYCQLSNYMGSNLPNTTDWNCTIEKTDSQFLNSWKYQANRSVIIRGVWLDAYNGNIYDEINVTGVYGYVDGWNETKDYEANKTWKSYDIGGDDYQFADKVKIILTFDSYNPSASNSTYNNNNRPDIEVSIYNGSVYLNNIYCSASTYMGSEKLNTTDWNCSKEFTQSDILDAWKYSGNRSIKIRGVWLDSYSSQVIDEINITNVYGYVDARNTTGGVYDCSDPNAILTNDTWVAFNGNPAQAWSNITKVITSQVGATVKWCVYANDTSNNWNGTSCQNPFSYVTTSANQPPSVETPKTYNENYVEKTSFANSSKVVIRANVTDPQGASDISKVLITILNSTNNIKVNNATMTSISSITNGYTYEYNYTLPIDADRGTWTIKVFANDTQNAWGSNSTTFSVYLVLSKEVTQPAIISDILQKTGFLTKTQTIIFSIQAVVARINVIIRPLTQSVSFIISTIRKVVSTRVLTQSVSFIISISRSISTTRELSQAISLIVSSIRNIIIYRFSEIVTTIVDIIWRSPITKLAILFQGIQLQATIEKIIYVFKTQFQILSVSSILKATSTLTRTLAQSITLTISILTNRILTLPQTINIQDIIAKTIYTWKIQTITIKITDAFTKVSILSRQLSQTISLTIAFIRNLISQKELPQTASFTLSIIREVISYRISQVTLTIASIITRTINSIRESVATFGISFMLGKAVLKPVEATIAIINIISRSINSIRILTILPSIQAIVTRVSYVSREFPQAISLALTLMRNIISQRALTALSSISLEVSKLVSSIRELPQAMSIIPTVLREVVVSRVVSLTTNIIDVLSRTVYSIRSFVEIINVQILISKSIPIIRSLTETINVVTTVLRERVIGKISMLAITIISALTRTAYTIRALPGAIVITDLMQRAFSTARELSQALNIQVLLKSINIRISTVAISVSDVVSRSIAISKTFLISVAVSIALKTISPARYWITLPSPPYGLFEWATRSETLILLFLGVAGISVYSLYVLFIHRRELIEHPIERYFGSERKEKKTKS